MRTYGCIASGNSEKDQIFVGEADLTEYKRDPITQVIDQGNQGSCVSQAIWELYNFYTKFNARVDEFVNRPAYLYDKRSDKSLDGMMPREAFEILKAENKIQSYARITNLLSLKKAILVNGGALIAMIARSDSNNFWEGTNILGGHAVAAIGFDNHYIYFKNSWGYDWGSNGLWKLPVEQFNIITEAWTILS